MADTGELQSQLADKDRELADLRQQLQTEVGTLNRLIEIAALLNSTLNLDELLQLIMSAATELLRAETGSILLVDEETKEMTVEVATGEPAAEVVKQRVPAGAGIAGHVVDNGEPLVVDDPRSDSRFYAGIEEAIGFETRNMLAVPLRTKEKVIGVVEIINKRDGAGFSDGDVRLATALANQAGTAIENARLYARLADAVVTSRLSYRL
jgi:GAF domain-containing protein